VTQNTLALPTDNFKAYLFDCDGTVADSMPLHYIAWTKALAPWNCAFSKECFYRWGGMPILEVVERLAREHSFWVLDQFINAVAGEAIRRVLFQGDLPQANERNAVSSADVRLNVGLGPFTRSTICLE
jgi:beta-phosphoglucomutase-like phosphatase (HAD superfamily)